MLELIILVVYEPERIEQLLDMDRKSLAFNIRRDFDVLKLPHPPEVNIRKPSLRGVVVSWGTQRRAPLYRVVMRVIEEQNINPSTRKAKHKCFIENIHLVEESENVLDRPQERSISSSTRRSYPPPSQHDIQGRSTKVKQIDGVMQSLRGLNMSLQTNQASHVGLPDGISAEKPIEKDGKTRLITELSEVREKLAVAILQADTLTKQLAHFNWPIENPEPTDDTCAQLTRVMTDLILERRRRQEIESLLRDVERECTHPAIVPMMLKAFTMAMPSISSESS